MIVREYLDQEDHVRRTPDLVWSRHRIPSPTPGGGTVAVIYVEAWTPAGREWHSRTKLADVSTPPDRFLIHPSALPILLSARDEGLVVEEIERTVVDDREDRP